jgi:hypothetical protein
MRKRGAVDCRRDGFLCSLGEETKVEQHRVKPSVDCRRDGFLCPLGEETKVEQHRVKTSNFHNFQAFGV